MRISALGALLIATACANHPLGPSAVPRTDDFYPAFIQPALAVLDADPWRHPLLDGEPMGVWVRRHVSRIEPGDLPDGMGASVVLDKRLIIWKPSVTIETYGLYWIASMLLHETRHLQQQSYHSCRRGGLSGDRTFEEGGAFAVHILYLEHVGETARAQWLREYYIGCEKNTSKGGPDEQR